jgi:hypothetical protein
VSKIGLSIPRVERVPPVKDAYGADIPIIESPTTFAKLNELIDAYNQLRDVVEAQAIKGHGTIPPNNQFTINEPKEEDNGTSN